MEEAKRFELPAEPVRPLKLFPAVIKFSEKNEDGLQVNTFCPFTVAARNYDEAKIIASALMARMQKHYRVSWDWYCNVNALCDLAVRDPDKATFTR